MNNITDFYFCEVEKQPVRFRITSYEFKLLEELIIVRYEKQIYNSDKSKILTTIPKSYKVKDISEKLDNNLDIVVESNPEYTNWKNFIPEGLTMEQIFYGNTIPKILRVNGLEGSEPLV